METVYFIQLKKLIRKSFYEKGKVFYKLYARIEDKIYLVMTKSK